MSNSHIQRAIIGRLKNADYLRYSALHDRAIDRDLFNYHLRQLVEKGVIEKHTDKGYSLSPKGQQRVADVLHTSDQSDRLFKFNALLVVTDQRPDGLYILNQHRSSQPDYGIVGVPGGTIVKEEPLLEGATRKLTQETGLSATFEYIALARRIIYKDGHLFADVLFPICLSTKYTGELRDTEFGTHMWSPIDDAIRHEDNRIPGLTEILTALRDQRLSDVRGRYYEHITR